MTERLVDEWQGRDATATDHEESLLRELYENHAGPLLAFVLRIANGDRLRAEDRSPLGAWALDRLGHLTSVFELSSLTRGRVMHYAIPEQLKKDFGVSGNVPRTHRWTPPASTLGAAAR